MTLVLISDCHKMDSDRLRGSQTGLYYTLGEFGDARLDPSSPDYFLNLWFVGKLFQGNLNSTQIKIWNKSNILFDFDVKSNLIQYI